MLSAKDLATVALAHVNDGVSPNGRRLLSAANARQMRQQTSTWRGIAGGGVGLDLTAPLFEEAGAVGVAKPLGLGLGDAEFVKEATNARIDPHPYVGQYESATLAFRVLPHQEGIALSTRPKLRMYDGDTLEESPLVRLRAVRDGHFTTGQGFVTFLNPSTDGRMQHLGRGQRLHKRTG
jgi:hypothetical protein